MRVFRQRHSSTNQANRLVPSIAPPSKSLRRICQVGVRGHSDEGAGLVDLIAPVALPPVTGGFQVGIRRHGDGKAGLIGFAISPSTFPSASEGQVRKVRVGRKFDGVADSVGLSIVLITLPSAPLE